MKKISIVGVEGSGKTVLLSAIGDKYENPDASGVFLSPENERAFGFTTMHMHAMRNGHWPVATTANSNLDWTLFRKADGNVEKICQISLLDFAGEAFRLCFGDHSEEEVDNWTNEVQTIKEHIDGSDILIVIVNLSDIINFDPTNSRSRETMWLTKRVLDYATRNGNKKEVAIVFSQADIYKAEIEACGGNEAALRKYLPHVANVYSNLSVLSVSAINKTQPDDITGKAVPAKDFDSEGIDELMEWIVSKMPGYEELAKEMEELRLAPIRLWKKARDLYAKYQLSQTLPTADRYSIACVLNKTLLELCEACEKSPKNAPRLDEVQTLEEESREILDFESKAKEVMSLITYSGKENALQRLDKYALESSRINAELLRLQSEVNFIYDGHWKRHQKKVSKILLSVVFIGMALCAGVFSYIMYKENEKKIELARQQEMERQEQERLRKERELELARQHEADMREKESQGYEIVIENGKKRAVWTSGRKHPENSYLVADSIPGKWNCTKPGYAWTGGDRIEWRSGLVHPENSNLKSSYSEGEWACTRPGYVWAGGNNIEWRAGQVSEKWPNWETTMKEGVWIPRPGYCKKYSDAKTLSELIWKAGIVHPMSPALVSASTEGKWICTKPGYVWSGDVNIRWQQGLKHPQNQFLLTSSTEGEWKCTMPGYVWMNGKEIKPYDEVFKKYFRPTTSVYGIRSNWFELWGKTGVTVSNESELEAAIAAIGSKGVINLKNGQYNKSIKIPPFKNITLIGESTSGVKIQGDGDVYHTVGQGGSLFVVNCTLNGEWDQKRIELDNDCGFMAINCDLGQLHLDKRNCKLILYNCLLDNVWTLHKLRKMEISNCVIKNQLEFNGSCNGKIFHCKFEHYIYDHLKYEGEDCLVVSDCVFDGQLANECAIKSSGPMVLQNCKFRCFNGGPVIDLYEYHRNHRNEACVKVVNCEFEKVLKSIKGNGCLFSAGSKSRIQYSRCRFTEILCERSNGYNVQEVHNITLPDEASDDQVFD